MNIQSALRKLAKVPQALVRYAYGKLPSGARNKIGFKAVAAGLMVIIIGIAGGGAWALAVVTRDHPKPVRESSTEPATKKSHSDNAAPTQDQPVASQAAPAGTDTPATSTPSVKKPSGSPAEPSGSGSSGSSNGSNPAEPLYGNLTLSASSVTLSKASRPTAPITISAPATVTAPSTNSQGTQVVLLASDHPSGTTFNMTVIMMSNDPAPGTYSVPIMAVHNGSGTRYYQATLTVYITE